MMCKYIVTGGNRLCGEIRVEGAKNSVLPILSATLLNGKENIILDCPQLKDVSTLLKMLELIGCSIKQHGNVVTVDSSTIDTWEIPEHLMREMRSSILLMGAMLGRTGKAKVSMPGGCELGPRPIDLHLFGLKALGVEVTESYGYINCKVDKLQGADIQLDYPSVGATENIMLAAVLAEGTTVIRNAAKEPEIVDLQNFLNHMGAKVSGAGTGIIRVDGVKQLGRTEYCVIPDRIVAGTYMVAAAITGGEVILNNVISEHLTPVNVKLKECGCLIYNKNGSIKVSAPKRIHAIETIRTLPFPGFPTDMQSQFMALATKAKGTSIFCETVFENRFRHVEELTRMGANIKIDGRVAIVRGVEQLTGTTVVAKDLRGGAALVLAALAAEGESIIERIYHIERGYEKMEDKIALLGGNIKRID